MSVDSKFGRKYWGDLYIKMATSFQSDIQDDRHGPNLENLFLTKGQLTGNLVESMEMTEIIAKIVPIGNPRWLPQPSFYKSISNFLTERPTISKLDRKYRGDL